MRITLVIWSLESGGAERVMSKLANAWVDESDVTLVTLSGNTSDHYVVHPDVRRSRLAMKTASSLVASIGSNWTMVRTLRRSFRSLQTDVVLSFMDRTNVQVLAATRGLGVPVVVSERIDPRFHTIPHKARLFRRLLYPRADAVVVQTESVADWCRGFVDPEKIWVIPNPVEPCEVEDMERASTILAVGRLDTQKGFDVLLDGFAQVAGDFPDWSLVILGEGSEREALEEQAAGLGVADRVSLPGVVDEPREFMSRAGVFVLSSRYEGFPNVVLEAMSCGTAVIATNCPSGPAEIITSGDDGVLIPPEDPAVLATQLGRLMSDAEERKRLGDNASQSVQRYSVDTIMRHWEAVFDSVTSSQKARTSS